MTPALRTVLVRDLEAFAREVLLFADDDLLWRTPAGVSNSAGNLALHVAGNLQHYVGAVLGGTGYVRDRPREFERRSGSRAEVAEEIGRAIEAVRTVLPRLTANDVTREFPEAIAGVRLPTSLFLVHLATHLAFHLGQAGYARRILAGDARTAGAMSVAPLANP